MVTAQKLTYEQFHNELFNLDDIAREAGEERFEDLDLQTRVYIQHRISELWINYRFDELV